MEVSFRDYFDMSLLTHSLSSGNGLVSYYINLVLEGVGVTRTETKAAINGGLQVRVHNTVFFIALTFDSDLQFLDRSVGSHACRLGWTANAFHCLQCWDALQCVLSCR